MKNEIVIYQSKSGAIEFKGDFEKETLWASQAQIVTLFGVHQSVISRHIRNIFKDGEINEKSNMQKMHITTSDKPVMLYSLDVLLSVGYRTNSKVAIAFRQWVSQTLRDYIIKGYTINRSRIDKNYTEFLQAVEQVKALLLQDSQIKAEDILELIKLFADTWLSLDSFDRDQLPPAGSTQKKVTLTADKLGQALTALKENLIKKNEATDLFGMERTPDALTGIIGNILQSFDDQELYPSIEEKAAHLLYFIVKNHPFVDGNKRSGAYAFIWFLAQAKILDTTQITPAALTAITLLIAESNPKDKTKMIGLVCHFLSKTK